MGTKKSKQLQLYFESCVLSIVLIGSVIAHAVSTATVDGNLLNEIDAPLPDYPKKAWEKSLEGMVTVKFDITKEGYVENPYIFNSSIPGEFELYALQAIKDHRYEPPDEPSHHTTGVTKNFFFTLDSRPKVPVKAIYPRPALENAAEGYAVVEFSVSQWGTVRDPVVVGAEPSGIFETAALDAAREMKFVTTRFKPNQKILHKFTFSLDSKPSKAVIAEYPAAAKEQKLHGHVIVEFDINSDGEVENPKAVFSDATVFETAAIDAVTKFGFNPDNAAKGVLHKIEFNLNQDYQPLSKVKPEYPRQALLDNVEGYVIVKFDIDEAGAVADPVATVEKPQNVFKESALTAVAQFKYMPQYIDGQPTRVKDCFVKISYEIADEDGNSPGRALENQTSSAQARYPMHRHTLKPTHLLYIQGNQENGSVIVEFDVNERGFVEQPKIIEVQDTRVSQEVSQRILEEVEYYRYTPFAIDDAPIGIYGVRHRIELRFQED